MLVFDRIANTIERVNVNSAGEHANSGGGSRVASISADGRFVVFDDSSTNLVENYTLAGNQIFLHDRELKETILVSAGVQDSFANGYCSSSEISANGQVIVFECYNNDDITSPVSIFTYDRTTGETELINTGPDGLAHSAFSPSISGDGRFVTFTSDQYLLNENNANPTALAPWIYVKDRSINTIHAVDVPSNNFSATSSSFRYSSPSISSNGRYIAYFSASSHLVADDNNGDEDYFVHDLINGDTVRLTKENGESLVNTYDLFPGQISPDGSQFIFQTSIPLISDDTNEKSDIYIVPTGF